MKKSVQATYYIYVHMYICTVVYILAKDAIYLFLPCPRVFFPAINGGIRPEYISLCFSTYLDPVPVYCMYFKLVKLNLVEEWVFCIYIIWPVAGGLNHLFRRIIFSIHGHGVYFFLFFSNLIYTPALSWYMISKKLYFFFYGLKKL